MEQYLRYIYPFGMMLLTFVGSWKIGQEKIKNLERIANDHETRLRLVELNIADRLSRIEESINSIKEKIQ